MVQLYQPRSIQWPLRIFLRCPSAMPFLIVANSIASSGHSSSSRGYQSALRKRRTVCLFLPVLDRLFQGMCSSTCSLFSSSYFSERRREHGPNWRISPLQSRDHWPICILYMNKKESISALFAAFDRTYALASRITSRTARHNHLKRIETNYQQFLIHVRLKETKPEIPQREFQGTTFYFSNLLEKQYLLLKLSKLQFSEESFREVNPFERRSAMFFKNEPRRRRISMGPFISK